MVFPSNRRGGGRCCHASPGSPVFGRFSSARRGHLSACRATSEGCPSLSLQAPGRLTPQGPGQMRPNRRVRADGWGGRFPLRRWTASGRRPSVSRDDIRIRPSRRAGISRVKIFFRRSRASSLRCDSRRMPSPGAAPSTAYRRAPSPVSTGEITCPRKRSGAGHRPTSPRPEPPRCDGRAGPITVRAGGRCGCRASAPSSPPARSSWRPRC